MDFTFMWVAFGQSLYNLSGWTYVHLRETNREDIG